MKKISPTDLKVNFLGVIPQSQEESRVLLPQEIVSFSALATYKGRAIRKLVKKTLKKGEKIEDRVKKTLRHSALKGHASLATTPVFCFSFEGSKFLDSALTGMYFGSFLMSSGRRTETTLEDIIVPQGISGKREAQRIYQKVSETNIQFYRDLLKKDIPKEVAAKILHYGIYGTGIVQLPLESLISLKREYQMEKEWMPQEIGVLLDKVVKKLKEFGLDLLWATRSVAPSNTYPYPNIFKDPQKSNLTRELINQKDPQENFKIISVEDNTTLKLKKELNHLKQEVRRITARKKRIKQEWPQLLYHRRKIMRDYNSALNMKILSSVPWRVWGEKKRHRTCPQIIESIYYSINRAVGKFKEFRDQIENHKIDSKVVEGIEQVFSIPPLVRKDSEVLNRYLSVARNAFWGYQKLVKMGIKPREAIFLIPRAAKIDILQEYNLYNLLTGYYPLRLCKAAEEEMRRNTIKEVEKIKKTLNQKGIGWLNEFIGPKCGIIGFCPERESCGWIKKIVPDYDEDFHQEMKENLEKRFQRIYQKLKD